MITTLFHKKRIHTVLTAALTFGLVLSSPIQLFAAVDAGITSDPVETESEPFESDINIYSSYNYLPVGTYDSADTAIIKTIDEKERTITLYNTLLAKTYTLKYDGTTYVSDKYGTPMSIEQMSEGTIVNVNFYKATRQLVDIQICPEAWTYESVTRYDLGGINSTATIGDRTYALTKGVQVFSKGEQTDLFSIVDGDVITVSGMGYDIYSIKVESGHGYVSLTGDEALIGGWIEVGNALITKVTEPGMLLTVPEGEYTVRMYNDSSESIKQIIVEAGQEILLDCSEITAPVDTFGRILFHITPESAALKMDGELKDHKSIIKTEYGVHEIEVSAPGYDTLQRYINVGDEVSEITIALDPTVEYTSSNSSQNNPTSLTSVSSNSSVKPKTSAASANSSSANSKKPVTTNKANRVYVYAPEKTEVYVDGLYAGLIPMSFKKVTGAHTIILKREGYETKSYTIYVYDDGEDMSISFSELTPIAGVGDVIPDDTPSDTSGDDTNKKKPYDTGKTDTDEGGEGNKDTETGDEDKNKDNTDGSGETGTGEENGGNTDTGDTGAGDPGTGSGTDDNTDTGNMDTGTGTEPGTDTGNTGTDSGTDPASISGSTGTENTPSDTGADAIDSSGADDSFWDIITRWFT